MKCNQCTKQHTQDCNTSATIIWQNQEIVSCNAFVDNSLQQRLSRILTEEERKVRAENGWMSEREVKCAAVEQVTYECKKLLKEFRYGQDKG